MERNAVVSGLLVLAGLLTSATSCEKSGSREDPGDPVIIDLSLKEKEIVTSANAFAFDLFIPIVSDESGKNMMISPFSVSSALSMTLNGAAGQTFEDMMLALRYGGKTIDEINGAYLRLMTEMVPVDKRVTVEVANSVWVEKRLTVKQPFIDLLKKYYLAEARAIDVTDPKAVENVNGWIEDKTHDRIQDMLQSLDPDLAMLLINAVYFKGQWRNRFDESATTSKPFYTEPGKPVNVPMMHQKVDLATAKTVNSVLIELPYGQGNYSMVIMLPDEGVSLADAAQTLNPENWQSWMEYLAHGTSEVELSMPRFRYEYKRLLNDDLRDLGMDIAFTPSADFSNISNQGLMISRVLHQTFIETNEEGTEAAAATVVEIVLTSMPMTTVVNVNRPFLYFIRETQTGTVIFMGQVTNPLQN